MSLRTAAVRFLPHRSKGTSLCSRPSPHRRLQSTPTRYLNRRALATASPTAGGAPQYIARSISAPPNHERHEGRRRAMLASLAVNPQPWRDPSKVREGGNGGCGHPAHRQSIAPLAPPGKPRGLVARPWRCRYILRPPESPLHPPSSPIPAKAVPSPARKTSTRTKAAGKR